jgi:hypothetical protein
LNYKNHYKKPTGHSNNLNLDYQKTAGGIIFEDGILYYNSEVEILRKSPGFDHGTIHLAKTFFDGEVVE